MIDTGHPSSTQKRILIALISLVVCFQYLVSITGVDITDQGYLLGNPHAWKEPYFLLIWGSVAVVNFIQYIFGDWSYLITKISPQFFIFFYLLFFLNVIKNNHNKQINFILLISLIITIPWATRSKLNDWLYYSTLSGLFITNAILLFDSALRKGRNLYFNLGFILILISVVIKITNILFLGLIPIYILFSYKECLDNRKKLTILMAIWLIVISLVSFLAFHFHITKSFITEGLSLFREFTAQTKLHSTKSLLQKNIQDVKESLFPSLVFILYLLSLYLNKSLKKFEVAGAVFINLTFILLSIKINLFEGNGLYLIYPTTICLSLLSKEYKSLRFLSICSVYFMLFNSAGSSNGIRAAFIAEPLCLFLSIFFLIDFKTKIRYFKISIIVSLSLIGIASKILDPYRDLPRHALSKNLSVPRLRGVYTHQDKFEALEKIYQVKKMLLDDAKSAIIYPSAPLLHYALDVTPFLPNPWINLYFPRQLQTLLNSTRNTMPDTVIRLLRNPRIKDWPNNKRSLKKDQDFDSIRLIDRFVLRNNYKLVWKDENFIVYKK